MNTKVKPKYTVAGISFATQKDVVQYIAKYIVGQTADFDTLQEDKERFVREYFEKYSEHDMSQVVELTVRTNPPYNSRGIWFKYKDGTERTASYYSPFINKTHRVKVLNAFSSAVSKYRLETKNQILSQTSYKCPIKGILLNSNNCKIVVCKPWSVLELCEAFLRLHSLKFEDIGIVEHHDGQQISLESDDLAQSFLDYYKANARLVVVHRTAPMNPSIPIVRRKRKYA